MLPRKRDLAKKARDKADPDRSEAHMKWIKRTFVCACWKAECCSGRMEAHHVRTAANSGTGIKPSDFLTVPLCAAHHAEGDNIGWQTFQQKYAVDLMAEALKLAKASPHKPTGWKP